MLRTKISPASTKEEICEEFIQDVGCRRYVIEDAETQQILATDLTRRQAMEFTWLHGGRDYEIRARMGVVHDDHGIPTQIKHQLFNEFGLEWDVYFKDGPGQQWRKSRITAYGETERLALLDLVDQAFSRQAWSEAFYVRLIGLSDKRDIANKLGPALAKRIAVGA